MGSKLVDLVRQNIPTGTQFETLIAALLTSLTGRNFRLAKSGFQAGRDISTREPGCNVIAVECKRYGKTTELNTRELQGELTQAVRDMPDIDLWVLVTSRDVPSQLYEALHQQAKDYAIEFFTVAVDGEPSSLDVLCSQAAEITKSFVEQTISHEDKEKLESLLESIAMRGEFDERKRSLQDKFSSPLIGYENWRLAQNSDFFDHLASETESRAYFGQPLNIRESTIALVPREKAWVKLDDWLLNWQETRPSFVLQGEEGDGKTWAAASWLAQRLKEDDKFPPVVFASSQKATTNDPLSLLSSFISHKLHMLEEQDCARRLLRWTESQSRNEPRLLLVLDGINERRAPTWWRQLLDQIAGSPWKNFIAVLITSRTTYWNRSFANLRHLKTTVFTLEPFDDIELNTALERHGLSRYSLPIDLLPMIRKPRYFDLMVKHRERISETGDITVARLVYEDWRDRLERKNNLELDDTAFQVLIRDLASRHQEGQDSIRENELASLLPFYMEDQRAVVHELETGGILKGEADHLVVDEHLLAHGFGLLLVEQLKNESSSSDQNLEELITGWLEPQAEMDLKAKICEFAALHALSLPALPIGIKVALLNAWIGSHNPGEGTPESFSAYFPVDPKSYLELAEVIWSEKSENAWGQELLMQAMLKWRDVHTVRPQLYSAFERWLGYVHIYGATFQRGTTEEDKTRARQKICDRVGHDLQLGPFAFATYPLTAIEDDGLLRLSRAALAVISHVPRGPFMHSITIGCVAEAVMGGWAKYDLLRWVLSTAPESVWIEAENEAKQLIEAGSLVAKQAAYRLLLFEGSAMAYQLQTSLPNDLFPVSPLYEAHLKDPCYSVFYAWNKETCETCIRRADLPANVIARKSGQHCVDPTLSIPADLNARLQPLLEQIKPELLWASTCRTAEDLNFEEYEPVLCAFAPYAIAGIVSQIVRQVDQREGLPLRLLAWNISEYFLLLDDNDLASIFNAWNRLHEGETALDIEQQWAEIALFKLVAKSLSALEQFSALLKRQDEAFDDSRLASFFLPLADWELVGNALASARKTKDVQRILWFISAHPESIPDDFVNNILTPYLDHEDSLVRGYVFKIACLSNSKKIIGRFLESTWAWSKSQLEYENQWGSLLLCRQGASLSYQEIANRVHPSYLGYAVQCRGMESGELDQYANDIHHIWERIRAGTQDLPSDFPLTKIAVGKDVTEQSPLELSSAFGSRSVIFVSRDYTWGGRLDSGDLSDIFPSEESATEEYQALVKIAEQAIDEQVEAGNQWFARDFFGNGLEQVLSKQPGLVSQWLDTALADNTNALRCIHLGRSFYERLCETLLQQDPNKGIALYRRLFKIDSKISLRDSRSGIRSLDLALFKAPPTTAIQDTWEARLSECLSDLELMRITTLAQHFNGQDWLQSYFDEHIESSAPLVKSYVFTLLGFADGEKSTELLSRLLRTEPDTWVKDLLERSQRRRNTNEWARHWYLQFINSEQDVIAWAAFRLFLRCVDSRFWFWQEEIESRVEQDSWLEKRLVFFRDNHKEVQRKIGKNEESLSETLFGQKIKSGQAWPWM